MRVQAHLMTAFLMIIVELLGFIEGFLFGEMIKNGVITPIENGANHFMPGLHAFFLSVGEVIEKRWKTQNPSDPIVKKLSKGGAKARFDKAWKNLKDDKDKNSIQVVGDFIDSFDDDILGDAMEHAILDQKDEDQFTADFQELFLKLWQDNNDDITKYWTSYYDMNTWSQLNALSNHFKDSLREFQEVTKETDKWKKQVMNTIVTSAQNAMRAKPTSERISGNIAAAFNNALWFFGFYEEDIE